MLNIAISNDQPIFSRGMKLLLETENRFNVVGIGKNEAEFNEIITRNTVNIAIVDFGAHTSKELAAFRKLRRSHPRLKIVAISAFDGQSMARELKDIGVKGYISKSCDSKDFMKAIHTVSDGNTTFPENVPNTSLQTDKPVSLTQPANDLSAREKEIVTLISQGFTSPAIAEKLFISINTVKGHRKNILKKLNLRNIQELVAFAIDHGFC